MNCPVDQETLETTDRAGVQVSRCPNCHGVWLDSDAVDEIVLQSHREVMPRPTPSLDRSQAEGFGTHHRPRPRKRSYFEHLIGGLD